MNHRPALTVLALASALFLLPGAALAAEVRSGTNADVAPGEVIQDDLFAMGQTVTVGGTVAGDAYATGQTVLVTGMVDGDLIAAAQQVIVDGIVTGDVRAAGAVVTINGVVERSVTGIAQQVTISSNGRVGGSLVGAGETISALGSVGRGVNIAGSTLQLAGPVGGDVLARVNTLLVAPTARVGGDLDYRADQPATIPQGTVGGEVQFAQSTQSAQAQAEPAPVLNGLFDLGGLLWLIGSGILGGVAIMLAPRASARAVELGRQQPLLSFGLGLLVLLTAPVAVVLIGATLVGIPVAITLAGLYVLALLLAWPAMALVLGTELARLVRRGHPLPVLAALVIGLIVMHLVTHLPIVGGLIGFLGITYGLGLIVQSARRRYRRSDSEPSPVAVPTPLAA